MKIFVRLRICDTLKFVCSRKIMGTLPGQCFKLQLRRQFIAAARAVAPGKILAKVLDHDLSATHDTLVVVLSFEYGNAVRL